MLLISSETPIGRRRTSGHDDGLLHGMRSQAAAVEHGFGARAVSATTGDEAVAALAELAADALRTGRPAYLGVPADVLGQEHTGSIRAHAVRRSCRAGAAMSPLQPPCSTAPRWCCGSGRARCRRTTRCGRWRSGSARG